jgi:hypothetical protein
MGGEEHHIKTILGHDQEPTPHPQAVQAYDSRACELLLQQSIPCILPQACRIDFMDNQQAHNVLSTSL